MKDNTMLPSARPNQPATPPQREPMKPTPQVAKSISPKPVRSEKAAPTESEIARRAYEIWLAEGQPAGQEQKNWFEAERQLRGQ